MEQIGVIGLSYRHADAEEIARFAIPKQDVPARLAALCDTLSTGEIVYLGRADDEDLWCGAHDCDRPANAAAEMMRAG